MDSDRQYLLNRVFADAKEAILASPEDYIWNEIELALAICRFYSGPERDEPTEPECRKMAKAIIKLKPTGLDLRTKSEDEDEDDTEPTGSKDTTDTITTDRVDTDEEPDNYVTDSEFPDYATNWDGTVVCIGGARKKKGKRMRPYAGWAKTASGKFYPTCYFRLSQNGVRHIQTPAQMLMRRFKTLNPKPQKQELQEVES